MGGAGDAAKGRHEADRLDSYRPILAIHCDLEFAATGPVAPMSVLDRYPNAYLSPQRPTSLGRNSVPLEISSLRSHPSLRGTSGDLHLKLLIKLSKRL